MKKFTIVGVDLAKNVFQLHAAGAEDGPIVKKRLSRNQFLVFMSQIEPCKVAMEACATSHHWARELTALGHDVQLIPPIYVKPFVKRQKNDANDAEAIVEAALRPSMRTFPVKSKEQQALAMLFRTRDLLVMQRTQLVHALRAHLAEHGVAVRGGRRSIEPFIKALDDRLNGLPDQVREIGALYLDRIGQTAKEIETLECRIDAEADEREMTRRLRTIPGVGPITAMAVEAFAPAMETFARGRDFSAWLGLVPRQHSSGDKQRLGRTSKMGQRDIRRLLISGAMLIIHWKGCNGGKPGSWLARMLSRKPRMVIAIALANKLARIIWAMVTHRTDYRDPAGAVC
jgi:transposase